MSFGFALSVLQGIYSRTEIFDDLCPLEVVELVAQQYQPPGYWLNIQVNLKENYNDGSIPQRGLSIL